MRLFSRHLISRDTVAGFLYIAIGAAAAIGATFYRLGSGTRPGPGFFPFILGLILVGLGAIILVGDLRKNPEVRASLSLFELRGPFFVLTSVLAFALLITKLGVIVAVAVMTLIGALACRESTWRASIVCAVIFGVTSVVLFRWALSVYLPTAPFILGY